MKVVLVQPRQGKNIGFRNMVLVEPLGLETVAGALVDQHEVVILDLMDLGEIEAKLQSLNPDAVGISCTFTVDTYRTLKIAHAAKSCRSKPFVFIGGHHASLSPYDFAQPFVDAVVIGEGELPARELLNALEHGGDLASVRGLLLNQDGSFVETGPRAPLQNMDDLPMPARELTSQYRKHYFLGIRKPFASIETSRGCPFDCNFCSVWKFYGRKVRCKSPERVAKELETIKEKEVLFTDDNFLHNVPRAMALAKELSARKLKKHYIFQARSDTIVQHPELVEAWKEVGLDAIFIGVEKIDDEGLQSVNKRNSAANNERALELLRKMKVGVYASFIVDPMFRLGDFQKLKQYIRRMRLESPIFSVLTPLPGTTLFKELKDKLTTTNYEFFDLLHAVLPTALPIKDFYKEFAGLYRYAYANPRKIVDYIIGYTALFLSGRLSINHVYKLARASLQARFP